MRATKLLSVMAMAACFAACTKEVLVQPEKAIDSFDEVKGGKVIAEGFAINPNSTQTKVDIENGNATWEDGDKAGVAWFVADGKPTADQSGAKLEDLYSTAYANHKLTWNTSDARFYSNSNVFEGWHVAYYPYQVMTRPSVIGFKVNPKMVTKISTNDEYAIEEYESSRVFSKAYHVTADMVVDGVIDTDMPLEYVTNVLRPKFVVADNFTNSAILDTLKIKSITLSTGAHALFADSLTVNPCKFPTAEETFGATHFGKKVGGTVLSGPAFQTDAYAASIATVLADDIQDEYTLGADDLNFRMFISPVPANSVAASDLSIKVELTGGSYFNLTAEGPNKAKFEALAKVLNGTHDSVKFTELCEDPVNITLELTESEYTVAYNVEDYEDWKACVNLATALGSEEVTFNVKPGSTIEFPAGDMFVPENCKIYVSNVEAGAESVKMTFNEATNWSSQINPAGNVVVVVEEDGILTLNSLLGARRIYNDGNIVALGGNDIKATSGVTNNGIINVSVGTEFVVGTDVSGNGHVVYAVEGVETETAEAITALIDKAKLDSLVVNNDLTLESVAPLAWNNVNVEMNGAAIESNAQVTANVWNVKAGENTITSDIVGDVTVAADATLTITGDITGDVTVNGELVVVGNITGNVTVAADAALEATNISGTLTNKGLVNIESDVFVKIGEIHNEGILLTTGANVYVSVITTKPNSFTTVDEDYVIYYTGSYTNGGGITTGKILKATVDNGYVSNDNYDKIDGTYFVKTDAGFKTVMTQDVKEINAVLNKNVAFAGEANQFVFGGATTEKVTINANGNTITFKQSSATADTDNYISTANNVELVIENATLNKTGAANEDQFVHNLKFACPVTLKNVVSDKAFNVMSDATFENVTIKDAADVYAIWIQPLGQTVQLKGTNLIDGSRGIKIEKSRANGEVKKTYLNVDGTTFKTTKKAAVLVNTSAGAVITWGVNNIEAVTADNDNAVWVDEACPTVDYLKVEVNGCTKIPEPTL